jgi:hypothetical protein
LATRISCSAALSLRAIVPPMFPIPNDAYFHLVYLFRCCG